MLHGVHYFYTVKKLPKKAKKKSKKLPSPQWELFLWVIRCTSFWASPGGRDAAERAARRGPPSPMAAAAARLSGRWKYAWLHLALWGSCGVKGQVELMDYSRTQWGCRLSSAAGRLSWMHHFYDNLSEAAAGAPEDPGAITSMPALCRIDCRQNPFHSVSDIISKPPLLI